MLGNTLDGIRLTANSVSTTIGGTAIGAGNVIGGNRDGIAIVDADTNLIQGNFIGTDPSGTLNFGNTSDGIDFSGNADQTVIGASYTTVGVATGEGNLIAFNAGYGVNVSGQHR